MLDYFSSSQSAVSGDDGVNSTGTQCPNDFLEDDSNDEVEEGEFNWDAQTQGWILGSFSMGYVTTMFVGGVLSEKYGGKWVFGLGICLSSFFGLLSPIAAKTSPYLLIAVRALQGACQGPLFPSLFALAKYWFPKEERNRLMTFSQAGKNKITQLRESVKTSTL